MKEEKSKSINQLKEVPVQQLLLKFSLPAVIALLVNALYSFIDRIFIGNSSGTLGIAAVAIVFPFTLVIGACASLVGMGAASLVSIRLGEKKAGEAEGIVGNALFLIVLMALVITALCQIYTVPILKALGASTEVLPYAEAYIRIILVGTIFQMTALGMNYFLRADGSPKKSMATMLIGNALNIVCTPILIFGFNMGIQGAAWATIFSQSVSAAWVMYYFLCGNSFLKLHIKNLKPSLRLLGQIIVIGAPSSVMIVTLSLSSMAVILPYQLWVQLEVFCI